MEIFCILSILFSCLVCFSGMGFAQTIDPEAVLIRNVLLIDPNEQAEDRLAGLHTASVHGAFELSGYQQLESVGDSLGFRHFHVGSVS